MPAPVTTGPAAKKTKRGPQSLIDRHELGDIALGMKHEGKDLEEIRFALNQELESRGETDRIANRRTLIRWFSHVPDEAMLHRQKVAQTNVVRTVNVLGKTVGMIERLEQWVEQAESEGGDPLLDDDGNPVLDDEGKPVMQGGPNWYARLGTARELRNHVAFYADVMERLWNAEQIEAFQETVLSVISDVDPSVAAEIRRKLRERESIRRSILAPAA